MIQCRCAEPRTAANRSCRGPCADPAAARGAGPGRSSRLGRRGDDRASEADDRQAAARSVRPIFRARSQGHRPAGAATRGSGSRRGRAIGRHRARNTRLSGPGLHPAPAGASAVTSASAARAGGHPGALRLSSLRRQAIQARRGRDRDAGGGATPVEGDPDRSREVQLPVMPEDHPAAPHPSTPSRGGAPGQACWR